MKKLLLTLAVLLISVGAFSQVLIFKVNTAKLRDLETEEITTFNDLHYLIVLNLDEMEMRVQAKTPERYFLTKAVGQKELIDDDGDKFTKFTYKATDSEGISCTVYLELYEDLNLTFITASYSNLKVMWQATVPLD